jgi:Zn-finger nucleic acid-binding protein
LPAPPLEANEERLLLESAAMDLFGTGKRQPPQVCPDCHHEIVKVVCLGTAVGVCVECKGTWLPYAVVQELGRQSEWFRELGRAFQLAREAEEKSRNAP